MVNIRSRKKVDKYPDFKKYRLKNPNLTNVLMAKVYHVSQTTVAGWLKRMKEENEKDHRGN
jgi:hypothetical protein